MIQCFQLHELIQQKFIENANTTHLQIDKVGNAVMIGRDVKG